MGLSLTRVDIDPLRKMDFFRHCPECGRRFQIRLVDKKLVRQERGSIPTREIVSGEYRYGMSFRGGGTVSGPPTVVLEGRPIVVDIEEIQYIYKCGHCGHEWSEKHVEKHKEG